MSHPSRIAQLQEQFSSGDTSARAALEQLVKEYLALVFRRLVRRALPGSPIALGIQRWMQERNGRPVDVMELPNADEVCRRFCDELLELPTLGSRREVFDTIPFFSQPEKR